MSENRSEIAMGKEGLRRKNYKECEETLENNGYVHYLYINVKNIKHFDTLQFIM